MSDATDNKSFGLGLIASYEVSKRIVYITYRRIQINGCFNSVNLRSLTSNVYDIEISWLQIFCEVTTRKIFRPS